MNFVKELSLLNESTARIKAFDFESEIAPFWHIQLYQCVGQENIDPSITEVYWKFRRGGGLKGQNL